MRRGRTWKPRLREEVGSGEALLGAASSTWLQAFWVACFICSKFPPFLPPKPIASSVQHVCIHAWCIDPLGSKLTLSTHLPCACCSLGAMLGALFLAVLSQALFSCDDLLLMAARVCLFFLVTFSAWRCSSSWNHVGRVAPIGVSPVQGRRPLSCPVPCLH